MVHFGISLVYPSFSSSPPLNNFQGSPNEVPQTEQLKQQKVIVSKFWGLQVRDQCASRVGASEGCELWNLFQASPQASGGLLTLFGVPWFVDSSS